ncbi:MAG: single-stranded-DNA-specific exonuclease RecJ [Candidatus Gracilibacteria bacterium]
MSVLKKNWQIRNEDHNLSITEKLLANRGIGDQGSIQTYLYPNYKKGFHNPFLMKDMDKAVDRIKKAVQRQEKIIIFGDYDVDGISGTAILYNTLKIMGARISYRLPHRVKDGYGLSNAFIEEFIKLGVNVAITVDCGISCKSQIDLAHNYGIDVIVTDHHTIPEQIPDKAYAILHPLQPGDEYPFKGLTGAGVAYKLASALITDNFKGGERDEYLFALLDLASMGTIADIGPIRDENRIIVKYGLEALKTTRWSGLQHLKNLAGILPEEKLTVGTIGFKIGPRINAAGRIDHPYYALQLLLSEDNEKGKLLAEHLEKLNQSRQQMVTKAMEEAETQYTDRRSNKIFVAWSPDWHVGILGLIAGKIAEKYGIPAMIMQDFGDYLVASARSQETFNVVDALTANRDYLEHFGGHAQAAGFNIRKNRLEDFVRNMEEYAEKHMVKDQGEKQSLTIDCEIQADDINESLMKFMDQMEPFGVGNEQPLFLVRNVKHNYLKRVGKESNHLSFLAQTGFKKFSTIAYKMGEFADVMGQAQAIDLACYLDRNEWKGKHQIQFRAVDFNPLG